MLARGFIGRSHPPTSKPRFDHNPEIDGQPGPWYSMPQAPRRVRSGPDPGAILGSLEARSPSVILSDSLGGPPLGDPLLDRLLVPLRWLARYHRYEIRGFEHIPRRGRAILVVNHSFATYDVVLLGAAILNRVRRDFVGLADRQLFRFPRVAAWLRRLGLTEASHANADAALRDGRLVCVAPGGMREALRPSTQRRRVLWQKRHGFVELAVRTRSPVILAACPNADDLFEVRPTFLTKFLYKAAHLPFAVVRGWGPTLLPRPVKLVHHVSSPMRPPRTEEAIERFHERLTRTMSEMLLR